ncbi:MAG: ABC transporter permease, partial [Lachnospiraceae bacterium]
PIVILADTRFLDYSRELGAAPRLDGAVGRNIIRDVTNPDFRHPEFMPYLKTYNTDESTLILSENKGIAAEIPVLSYTEEVPVLREEYATENFYELVHFIPVSLWKDIKKQSGGANTDLYIRILARDDVPLRELDALQNQVDQLLGTAYTLDSENRIQAYETNHKLMQGMRAAFGGFCVLLAVIGIGDVFSNTLGFIRQRKREFARYMSIGLTPYEIRKMFCIEAVVLAGRPILITLPLAVIAVGYMLKMSYLGVGEFMAEAPLIPIAIFMAAILGAVMLAYAFAWRNVRKISLADALKDDTMM